MTHLCPDCLRQIPLGKNKIPLLACPHCLADKSYQATLKVQRQFMRPIASGEITLTFRRASGAPKWHIALGSYKDQAWCGELIHRGWKDKMYRPWIVVEKSAIAVCPRCREMLTQMLAEAKVAEVQ